MMYVQWKNYSLGKTTHERFSKRAASIKAIAQEEDITEEGQSEKLLGAQKKQKRKCCTNCKSMMYTKERPT